MVLSHFASLTIFMTKLIDYIPTIVMIIVEGSCCVLWTINQPEKQKKLCIRKFTVSDICSLIRAITYYMGNLQISTKSVNSRWLLPERKRHSHIF
jgi:hypothetical protein